MTRNDLITVYFTLIICFFFQYAAAIEDFNVTDEYSVINRNGKAVYISEELMKKLDEEVETWHWTPWLRTRTQVYDNIVLQAECPTGDSVDSFPDSLFTDEQLRQGGFVLYVLFGIYAFTLLAIVCNDFFIPCVELICEDLKIPQNVAAATFMAVATSCPEFFVNVISTFLTESDMGIGTIVGSAIFNALGVAAIGGLAAIYPIAIEMRPVTRDVVIYMVNVSVLVIIVWDGQVDWYEALVLGIMYILYFVLMFNSIRLFNLYDKMIAKCCKTHESGITEPAVIDYRKSVEEGIKNEGYDGTMDKETKNGLEKAITIEKDENENNSIYRIRLLRYPSEEAVTSRLWWLYTWPIKLLLGCTIPSVTRFRRFYPLAFVMCIVWIGVNSYVVSWSMTVIGHTFFIPESVMGMTFLAFGGCLPEACSIFIMSRRGEGGIGVSNALGANSLAILFALGVPWLIKTVALVVEGADNTAVYINSAGIDFVVGSLLVAVVCLWITLYVGKFMLRRSIGFAFATLYVIFITFAILVEMGVILDRGIVTC